MFDLKSRIDAAGMTIPDSLHAMLVLRALPSNYEVVQQTILANVRDYKTLTSANMRSRLLSEELRQGTTTGVNAIRPGKKAASTDSCNWCGGTGHWERDCKRKQRGLSREEAQSERKKGNKGKGKQKNDKVSLSVNTVIEEAPPDLSSSNTHVAKTSTPNDVIIFYTGCETRWMLDSGCSDHITHVASDLSEYLPLASCHDPNSPDQGNSSI